MSQSKQLLLAVLILVVGRDFFAQQILVEPVFKLKTELRKITSIGFSMNGATILVGDEKGKYIFLDNENAKVVASGSLNSEVIFADFLNDDSEVLLLDSKGQIEILDGKSFKPIRNIHLNDSPTRISIDPNKQYLSYITKDFQLKTFNLRANMVQSTVDISNRMDNSLYIGYDRFGQQVAVLSDDGTAIIYNPNSQKVIRESVLRSDEFHGSSSVMHSAASNKGSDLFITAVQEVFIPKGGIQGGQPERRNSLMAYDWDSSSEIKRIRINNRPDQLVLGPGPNHLAYFTNKRFEITLVDITQGAEVSSVTLDEFPEIIKISDNDAFLASGDKNGSVYLYSLQRNSAPEIKIVKPILNRNYGEIIIEKDNIELEGMLSDKSNIKKVSINGNQVELLANNKFKGEVNLMPGKNKIRLVAEDYQANVVYKDIYITRKLDTPLDSEVNSENINKQKRVALVIGNSEYEGSAMLSNTLNDAKAMEKVLKGLGFKVTTVINGSYEDMKAAIYKYGDEIRDVDVSLFFYAGHGLEVEGINYLVPIDANISSSLDVKLKTVPLTGILRTIDYANEDGLNMIILDACRNNPFPTGTRGGAGLAKTTPPGGTIIAYSTAPGSVASDGEGENGLYTGELIKQINSIQRIEDVFMKTRIGVEELSNGAQQPWEEARLKGVFYLKYE